MVLGISQYSSTISGKSKNIKTESTYTEVYMRSYTETFLSLFHFKMRRVFLPNCVLINVPYQITVTQAVFNLPATLLPSLEMKSPWVPRTVL